MLAFLVYLSLICISRAIYLTEYASHRVYISLGVHLTGRVTYRRVPYGRAAHERVPHGRVAHLRVFSALRVVKSCRKTAQRPRCCSKPKQQLCIQNGTRAYYLNYLQKREKRRQSDWLANQMDRQVIDRQVETKPMSAGTQADRAAS